MKKQLRMLTCGLSLFVLTLLPACVVVHERPTGEPPPWAPAHGHRARHTYHYYPDRSVYYDVSRRLYFYPSKGNWVMAPVLPPAIRIEAGRYNVLEMDSDTPYAYHQEVTRRYPPGQLKKR